MAPPVVSKDCQRKSWKYLSIEIIGIKYRNCFISKAISGELRTAIWFLALSPLCSSWYSTFLKINHKICFGKCKVNAVCCLPTNTLVRSRLGVPMNQFPETRSTRAERIWKLSLFSLPSNWDVLFNGVSSLIPWFSFHNKLPQSCVSYWKHLGHLDSQNPSKSKTPEMIINSDIWPNRAFILLFSQVASYANCWVGNSITYRTGIHFTFKFHFPEWRVRKGHKEILTEENPPAAPQPVIFLMHNRHIL